MSIGTARVKKMLSFRVDENNLILADLVDRTQGLQCPKCGNPLFKGVLGAGTLAEFKCGNKLCRRKTSVGITK